VKPPFLGLQVGRAGLTEVPDKVKTLARQFASKFNCFRLLWKTGLTNIAIIIRLVDKSSQKVLLTDLLRKKNTTEWLIDSANKLKRTSSRENVARLVGCV
jgi:hypothetical protein